MLIYSKHILCFISTQIVKDLFLCVIKIMFMKTLGQRIAFYRKAKKMSQAQLAEACGWASQSRIGNYEKDIREPSLADLELIAESLGIDRALLIGDKIEPLLEGTVPDNYFKSTYLYPVISWVSAGLTCEAWQPEYTDDYMHTDINAGKRGFWLKVKGDSMTASNGFSFPEGMYILVNPDIGIDTDSFIVAKIIDNNEATFKQYIEEAGIKYLKPLNSSYKTTVLDERWQIVGKVVDARWKL